MLLTDWSMDQGAEVRDVKQHWAAENAQLNVAMQLHVAGMDLNRAPEPANPDKWWTNLPSWGYHEHTGAVGLAEYLAGIKDYSNVLLIV